MKELTSYNRVAGYLNKIFDLLNEEFFESALSRPTITIQSTPRAYGHFSLREDTWISKNGESHEINIGAGTLARPIEEVCATLLHEMVHYHNYILGVQDCSRGGTYHNKRFKASAEAHGLLIDHLLFLRLRTVQKLPELFGFHCFSFCTPSAWLAATQSDFFPPRRTFSGTIFVL